MPPRLQAVGGPLTGATIPLAEPEMSVGRDDANALTLSDPSVSPCHCVLTTSDDAVAIRDLDRANPSFVNGLPAGDRPLQDGDQIQIGASIFVVSLTESGATAPAGEVVTVNERPAAAASMLTMGREDVFGGERAHDAGPAVAVRESRDLDALIRISAAMNAIRGLVALERPLLELIADVVPATRGAIVFGGDRPADIMSAVGWNRGAAVNRPVDVSRAVIERVIRDVVGVLSDDRCSLAAPLVTFDKPIGAILLETDDRSRLFDGAHLRLVMAVAAIAATAFEHARQVESLEDANRRLQAQINVDHNMVGESRSMRDVYRRIGRVAPTDSTVLIRGESGTGKELVARAIHRNSPRAEKPFVAINCAAITETLLESELFGHEKGAFTGAVAQKKGKIETAEGGTLFLDEIGEMSLALQAKLLRALQDREFERVGGTRRIKVDFRLVAATNRDLEVAIDMGAFRRDLYYRLNVVAVTMPPLRERRDDIPLLASWFVRRHGATAKRPVSGLSAEAVACLTAYDWPGNVRELENAIEHAVVLGTAVLILPDDLPDAIAEADTSRPAEAGGSATLRFHDAIKQTKKELILRAVEESAGNYNGAARLLGLHPNYLHRLIKNLQLKSTLKSS